MGALNQQASLQALHGAVTRLHQAGQPLSLVLFDLDNLKRFNETHGFPAGDEMLRQVAAVTRALSPDHALSRYGSEEFALVLPRTSRKEAAQRAERLRQAIAAWQSEHPADSNGRLASAARRCQRHRTSAAECANTLLSPPSAPWAERLDRLGLGQRNHDPYRKNAIFFFVQGSADGLRVAPNEEGKGVG